MQWIPVFVKVRCFSFCWHFVYSMSFIIRIEINISEMTVELADTVKKMFYLRFTIKWVTAGFWFYYCYKWQISVLFKNCNVFLLHPAPITTSFMETEPNAISDVRSICKYHSHWSTIHLIDFHSRRRRQSNFDFIFLTTSQCFIITYIYCICTCTKPEKNATVTKTAMHNNKEKL